MRIFIQKNDQGHIRYDNFQELHVQLSSYVFYKSDIKFRIKPFQKTASKKRELRENGLSFSSGSSVEALTKEEVSLVIISTTVC